MSRYSCRSAGLRFLIRFRVRKFLRCTVKQWSLSRRGKRFTAVHVAQKRPDLNKVGNRQWRGRYVIFDSSRWRTVSTDPERDLVRILDDLARARIAEVSMSTS